MSKVAPGAGVAEPRGMRFWSKMRDAAPVQRPAFATPAATATALRVVPPPAVTPPDNV
jgi:hypothetical protein